jgi:hypothetical protein
MVEQSETREVGCAKKSFLGIGGMNSYLSDFISIEEAMTKKAYLGPKSFPQPTSIPFPIPGVPFLTKSSLRAVSDP